MKTDNQKQGMETEKKQMTLQECKDQVAKKNGFKDWGTATIDWGERTGWYPLIHESYTQQVAELYASSKTEALMAINKEMLKFIDDQHVYIDEDQVGTIRKSAALISKAKQLNDL